MANEKILDVPFHEPSGSDTAQDLSPNKANVAIVNGDFVPGRIGNAVEFQDEGRAEIIPQYIPLDGVYTLSLWALAKQYPEGPTDSWFMFRFLVNGSEEFLMLSLRTPLTGWTYIAILQDQDAIVALVNSRQTDRKPIPPAWGKPVGFSLLNDNPFDGDGHVSFQDFNVYYGVDGEIVVPPVPMKKNKYYVDGQMFRDQFAVKVSKSDGIMDNLKPKEFFKVDWPDYHGEVIDFSEIRFEPRDITLTCFVDANGQESFWQKVDQFVKAWMKSGLRQLIIDPGKTFPMVYMVYVTDTFNMVKKWSDQHMVGTFELKLREPSPIKRVLRFQGNGTVTISFSSEQFMVDIYWGDGTVTEGAYGLNQTISHNYTSNKGMVDGYHYIVVSGVLEEMASFSSNAQLIYSLIPQAS